MRIDRVGAGPPAAVGRRRAGPGFRLGDAAEPAQGGASGVHAAAPVSVLGLQQPQGPAVPVASHERRLETALEDLGALQRALLGETLGSTVLERMAKHAEELSGADPALRDVAAAIGLRVRVELARRQKMEGANTTNE